MKPSHARDILRERTAYTAGRAFNNVILFLSLLGSGLLILAAFAPGISLPDYLAAIAIANALFCILLWAALHALFDIADAALVNVKLESTLS